MSKVGEKKKNFLKKAFSITIYKVLFKPLLNGWLQKCLVKKGKGKEKKKKREKWRKNGDLKLFL